MTLNPMDRIVDLYDKAERRLAFRATTKSDAVEWQSELRDRLTALIGGIPEPADEFAPEMEEPEQFPGYTRQRFTFLVRPGERVIGYLLIPDLPPPHPVMICVPGHGRGVDSIVHEGDDYSRAFAVQAVKRGMAAVAIEPVGFGHRRDPISAAEGPSASACQPIGAAALLFGQTITAWRVHDIMRTIDWIETRPDFDSGRIGCMGISGGGLCTLFGAALDERIKVAFVSGYLNTFRASIVSLSHCVDNYIPGILDWCEEYDIAGLIAPRPLFAEFGEIDPIFPVEASQFAADAVAGIYDVFGAGENFAYHRHPGEHEFNGTQGFPFCGKHLGTRSEPAP
jgi:dienelactone hydrolase